MHDFPVAHIRALNDLGPSATIHPGAVLRVLEGTRRRRGGSLPRERDPPERRGHPRKRPDGTSNGTPAENEPLDDASRVASSASGVFHRRRPPERVARSVVAVVADAASALANLAFGGASRLVRLRLRCGDGASSSSGPAFVVVGDGESLAAGWLATLVCPFASSNA